jgi:tetratricopeptide (TPR) repeat protein
LEAAEEAFMQRDWTKAAILYERALKSVVSAPKAWMSYARSLWNLGRLEDAFRAGERAVAVSPDEVDPWLLCGEIAEQLAEDTTTEQESDAWGKRAEELYNVALQQVGARIQVEHENAQLWEMRGDLLDRVGRRDEGLQSYKQALAIEPNRVTSWIGCGRILGRLGRLDEALQSYETATGFEPGRAYYWTARARILNKQGKLNEAVHSYAKALELRPEQASYWADHAKLLDELGRFE